MRLWGCFISPAPTAPAGALLTCPRKLSQSPGPWMRGEGRISLASSPMFPLALNSTQRLSILLLCAHPPHHPPTGLPARSQAEEELLIIKANKSIS